jgi:PEGA domain-containing protein
MKPWLAAAVLVAVAGGGKFMAEYQAGIDAFNLAHYDEAWRRFSRARDLEPGKPGPWRWLGRTARVLERWEECLVAARRALVLAPRSPLAPEVRADVDRCRAALGRPPYRGRLAAGQGALAVIADVEGARVLVDGIEKGITPIEPVPLNVGVHVVRLAHDGYPTAELRVDVIDGVVSDAVITMRRPSLP